jgi:hypothetical protein
MCEVYLQRLPKVQIVVVVGNPAAPALKIDPIFDFTEYRPTRALSSNPLIHNILHSLIGRRISTRSQLVCVVSRPNSGKLYSRIFTNFFVLRHPFGLKHFTGPPIISVGTE